MSNLIEKIVIWALLRRFKVLERSLPEETVDAALVNFYDNQELQKYINIIISNIIRRHLYVANMEQKAGLSGQFKILRVLQERARQAKEGKKG